MIAATLGPIIAGAMAERIKIYNYYVFCSIMTGVVYPMVLASTWGGGWLHKLGFRDWAGASVVHLVGGTAAFCGSYMIGPRYYRRCKSLKSKDKSLKYKDQKTNKDGYQMIVQKYEKK